MANLLPAARPPASKDPFRRSRTVVRVSLAVMPTLDCSSVSSRPHIAGACTCVPKETRPQTRRSHMRTRAHKNLSTDVYRPANRFHAAVRRLARTRALFQINELDLGRGPGGNSRGARCRLLIKFLPAIQIGTDQPGSSPSTRAVPLAPGICRSV